MHRIPATKRAGINRRKPRLVLPSKTGLINIAACQLARSKMQVRPCLCMGLNDQWAATLEIAAGREAQPKARTKRPRPTFDDGSVTRVFKFPSKAYPRSSYYVTSTEIIIRIKKARKRWTLVIPKKRVTAYRTNRWFAKPRWVEIELTYTQASKLGLVEPRTPSTEVTSGISAEQQVARHPIVDSDHTLPGGSASEPEPDSTSTWQRLFELDPNVDQPGRLLNTDDVDFVSDDDHLEDGTVLPKWLPHDGSRVPLLQTLSMADADVCSRQSRSAVAAARPRTDRAAPRASAFLLIASSALGLLSVAAAWITLSSSSTTPMTVDLACTHSEQTSPCSQTIVTGAIGKVDQPQWPEPRPSAALATLASSEPISAIEQLRLNAPQIPKTSATPTEREDMEVESRGKATQRQKATYCPLRRPENLALRKTCLPTHDCRELRAASQSINIHFDYASSSLNQAILPAPRVLCSEAAILSVDQGDY